jgi:hypothetical protein
MEEIMKSTVFGKIMSIFTIVIAFEVHAQSWQVLKDQVVSRNVLRGVKIPLSSSLSHAESHAACWLKDGKALPMLYLKVFPYGIPSTPRYWPAKPVERFKCADSFDKVREEARLNDNKVTGDLTLVYRRQLVFIPASNGDSMGGEPYPASCSWYLRQERALILHSARELGAFESHGGGTPSAFGFLQQKLDLSACRR